MSTRYLMLCNTRRLVRTLAVLCSGLRAHALALVLATACATTAPSLAQCSEGWLPGLGPPGVNGSIGALAVLPGGDVIAGGVFGAAGDVPAQNIARYNPATGAWADLAGGVNGVSGEVRALVVLPGGDVIVGGYFTTAGGVPVQGIARYNPATGTWSDLGGGEDCCTDVYALSLLPSGDVIVGGWRLPTGNIARYNPATGAWSAMGSGPDGVVRSLALLPDGDMIVGGQFTNAGGSTANNIARYNPTTDTWSPLASGVDGATIAPLFYPSVETLAVLPGGDVIVGGSFDTAGGMRANNIARYNPATGVWSDLGDGVIGGEYTTVETLAVLPDGDVIVGGHFEKAGGTVANPIARYSPGTGLWSPLGSGVSAGSVSALAVMPSGDVLVGGYFDTAGTLPTNGIARYNPATGLWSAPGGTVGGKMGTLSPNPSARALAVVPGGDVIVGGSFTAAGGTPAGNIARYNTTTNSWSAMAGGVSGLEPIVFTTAVLPDGDVIVGGLFEIAGGIPASNIARYNPATNTWSALGSGRNGPVYALAVLPGGDVIVGGGNDTFNSISRYNPTTGVWSDLGSGLSPGDIYALAVLPGGDVIVAGLFYNAGGIPARNIARYNPATNTWSPLGSGLGGPNTSFYYYYFASTLVVLPDGDVIVGGFYETAGDVPARNIARYNPATNTWSALGSGWSDFVSALALLPGGDVIVGGWLGSSRDQQGSAIARYNPTTGAWSALGSGPGRSNPLGIHAIAVLPGGDLLVGGQFDPWGLYFSRYIARYTFGNPADVAGPGQSIGGDNAFTADDIIVFLNWYFANDPRADVAGAGQSSTPDGQFTADDIIVFLNRFFAGC
jgi:uncharacterized delta-60 repeat protein